MGEMGDDERMEFIRDKLNKLAESEDTQENALLAVSRLMDEYIMDFYRKNEKGRKESKKNG